MSALMPVASEWQTCSAMALLLPGVPDLKAMRAVLLLESLFCSLLSPGTQNAVRHGMQRKQTR